MALSVLNRIRTGFGDPILLLAVLGLSLFGIAMVYSAGQLDVPNRVVSGAWERQLVWFGISLAALLFLVRVQVRWLEWLAIPLYIITIGLLIATLIVGTGRGTAAGVKSWLELGPVAFQPSQFANIATILMLARVMGNWRETPRSLATLWKPIMIVGLPLGLVFLQPDLGTAMVFGAVLLATMFWAGTPVALIFFLISPLLGLFLAANTLWFSIYMVGLLAFLYFYRVKLWEGVAVASANFLAGAVALPIWNSLEDYQKARLLVFLDPMIDPRGAGYHVIQSKVAIGSGGLIGKGFTLGTQKRLQFLPEQHTDFIFSVVGEELGFLLGTMPVLLVYALILWRLVRIAERTVDPFAGIVVFGFGGAWFAHILVNIGMTVGVMPITGIPLPFLSYGGSFLLATYMALAISQRIASEQGRI